MSYIYKTKTNYINVGEQMSVASSTQESIHHHHHHKSSEVSKMRKQNMDSSERFKSQSLHAIKRKKQIKKALYYFLILVAIVVVGYCAYIYTI